MSPREYPPLAAPPVLAEDLRVNPPTTDHAALDRSLVHGIVWTSAVKWGSQGLAWVATLVVARKLGPEAYGLVRRAMVYMGLIAMLGEAGIGTAVINLRHLDEERIAQVNGAAAILGAG